MLNLQIAMMRVNVAILGLIATLLNGVFQVQTAEPGIQVSAPLPGSALQGSVVITGNTTLADFQSAEVDFSYIDNGPTNWFLIQQSPGAVKDGTLAVWDTSTIADGNYRLKVQVVLEDGRVIEKIVPDLRVRNYTPVETSTPTAPAAVAVNTPAVLPTATLATNTPQPTPTDLPPNPAQVKPEALWFNIILGVSFIAAVLFLLGIYTWLKGKSH